MSLFGFLNPKPKHILNENGENIIFHKNEKDQIRMTFTKKDGKIVGDFHTYYLGPPGRQVVSLKANFKNGKIDGNAYEYSISALIKRIIEFYDEGSLIKQTVYMSSGELHREEEFTKSQNKKGIVQNRIEDQLKDF